MSWASQEGSNFDPGPGAVVTSLDPCGESDVDWKQKITITGLCIDRGPSSASEVDTYIPGRV